MSSFNEQLVALLPHMRAFALSMTRDRAFADDIAQEAAARALANRDSYRPDTNFKAWVFTILRNALYSESQRHWRHKERSDEEAMLACGSGGGQEARLEMGRFHACLRVPAEGPARGHDPHWRVRIRLRPGREDHRVSDRDAQEPGVSWTAGPQGIA